MKKKRAILGIAIAAIFIFGAGFAAGAAGSEPGSNGDPLITKSYLDSRISSITEDAAYQEVTLSKGKRLVCAKGAQIVVLTGTAKATAPLSDITKGSRIAKNKTVDSNHNCLVTKDNTGVKASKSCTIFVTGSYTIK